MSLLLRRPLIATAVGALLALAVVAGIAWAKSSEPAKAAFTGCLNLDTGRMSGVALGQKPAVPCRNGLQKVSWEGQAVVGINGTDGATGASGPVGASGAKGAAGPAGLGAQGVAGPQGLQGVHGPQGPNGVHGTNGAAGADGKPGSKGPAGATGKQGSQGVTGLQGLLGQTGAAGATGNSGALGGQGSTGPQGLAGPTGKDGGAGPAGPTGPQGSTGTPGATGSPGATGAAGPAGQTGATGPGFNPNCPANMTRVLDLCVSAATPGTFNMALAICAAGNRRLPTLAEVLQIHNALGGDETTITSDLLTLTDAVYVIFSGGSFTIHSANVDNPGDQSNRLVYRCVYSPGFS